MKARDYFPLGMAEGIAFCNRVKETKWLLDNVLSGKHSLLISPRRYGKSSLAARAIKKSGLPNTQVDFFMATSEKIIEQYIVKGVTDLIGKAIGPVEKILNSIKKYFAKITPKLIIKTSGIALEFDFPSDSDPASNVKQSLLLLEKLLAEKNQKAVMFLDEFQIVGVIAKGLGIEGAIRHIAQKTKYLTFIFSGSNRRLLKSMFEEETRPLYKLCRQLYLKRISFEDYKIHLNKIAKKTWNGELSEAAIKSITDLSERHPYYLNKLCDIIWSENELIPSEKQVLQSWQLLLEEERSDTIKELSALSIGQKKVLTLIAIGKSSNLMSKEMSKKTDMSPSSIASAIGGLKEKDIIQGDDKKYRIINPVIKAYVANE